MEFGSVPLSEALGATLAHSLNLPGRKLGKGQVLTRADLDEIAATGRDAVTVARIAPGDIDENRAAERVAAHLAGAGLSVTAPFSGRVNLMAERAGLLRVRADAVNALNAVDEAVTLATLPDCRRVTPGALVATVKVIPYAVAGEVLERAEAALRAAGPGVLDIRENAVATVALILTRTEGFKESLLAKAETVTRGRTDALGVEITSVTTVAHETDAVAAAIAAARADMVLVFGASATSDRGDVVPAGLVAAGGEITRFGMPVDPGNLLFLGRIGARPVVGLPGCARSPALNGVDWVLERLVAGQDIGDEAIAAMGVGGLLKEIPARSLARRARPRAGKRVEIVLLAAGASRRMQGEDKLLRDVGGRPLLRHAAQAALASRAAAVRVVLPLGARARAAALEGLAVDIVEAREAAQGMGASLAAGMGAVSQEADAVIVALADMPEVTAGHHDRLIAALDVGEGREICRAVAADGTPGHPVLFSRRFFETLAEIEGDRGARDVLLQMPEMVVAVPTEGQGALVDLDTPEAWAAWEEAKT